MMSGPKIGKSSGAASTPRRPRRHLSVELCVSGGDWSALGDVERDIQPIVDGLAAAVVPHVELPAARSFACVALSCDAEVRSLNNDFRRQDKPTNVLSFPSPPPPRHARAEPINLGDVILAQETLAREAAEQRIPRDHHFRHLVVHGLLHLLGFDHETDTEAHEMEALETLILTGLGIPDPYAEPASRDVMPAPESAASSAATGTSSSRSPNDSRFPTKAG